MAGIEETFEQNNGGQPVDGLRAFFNADAAFAKHALGLYGGEAFVPQLNRDGGGGGKAVTEFAGVCGTAPFVPAHVQRVAHQYQCDVVLGSQFRQAVQILTNIGPLKGFQTLRGDAEFVAERQSDAPFAQIQGQDSAYTH